MAHPLVDVAVRRCGEHDCAGQPRVGRYACGAAWELAIRDDERVVVEHGLFRELVVDRDFVDEVAVRLALRGGSVELTRAERRALRRARVEQTDRIRACYASGMSRPQIARRLGLDYDAVPEPPQRPGRKPPASRRVARPTPAVVEPESVQFAPPVVNAPGSGKSPAVLLAAVGGVAA